MPESTTPLPALFVERAQTILPPDRLDAAMASFGADRPVAFRLNPLRRDPADTLNELNAAGLHPQPVKWCDHAYTLSHDRRDALLAHPAFEDGRVYVQNLSSMLAPLALEPGQDEHLLDLAAAPGGKTLQIAAMTRNQASIEAVEVSRDRFYKLKANAERAAATAVTCHRADGRFVGKRHPLSFDATLLDAPCSGEGRFDPRDPETFRFWSQKKINQCAALQKALLRSAIDALKPGGRVIYATCTLAPEENELVLHHTLRRLGDAVRIEPIELPIDNALPAMTAWKGKDLNPQIAGAQRVCPNDRFTAFFLARLIKQA